MEGVRRLRRPLLLLALACLSAPRAAAQVRYDACEARPDVTFLPYSDLSHVAGATLEPGEPVPTCAAGGFAHSVWYAMTPPRAGVYLFSTCGSDFDTTLQIYGEPFFPSCEGLTPRPGGCSADSDLCGPGSRQSAVLVRLPSAVPGLTTAQVGSVGPAAGTLRFNMSLVPEALNDGCPAARVVNHPVFRDVLDMANATGGETADRTFLSRCGAAGSVDLGASPHSVWYLYRAARAGPVAIDTRGTTTAIVVAVFNETPAGCGRLGSRAGCAANRPVVFDAVAGRSYRILVVTPTAVPPDVLVFRLTGPNTPPVATAAATARIAPGTRGALDARRSRDPDGDPLTFAWTQTAGPPVVLSDPGAASVGFTAPVVRTNTTLRFQVSVGDGAATSVATASVLVDVSLDDPDRDGVPAARDRCRGTPPGAPVDADGCSCSDTGHADCAALGTPCTPGSCDPATGACVVAPAPRGAPCTEDGDLCTDDVCDGAGSCGHLPVDCARACRDDGCDPTTGACVGSPLAPGTRCADDGNPCTDDVCDGTGTCRHDAVDSFPGATCRLDDLAGTFAAAEQVGTRATRRLERLLATARVGITTADAFATVGDRARAAHRLKRASRALRAFARGVARLETKHLLSSEDTGHLLDLAGDVEARIRALRTKLRARR